MPPYAGRPERGSSGRSIEQGGGALAGDGTSDPRRCLEAASAELLAWGHPEVTIDAFEAGEIVPGHFRTAAYADLAGVVVAAIDAGQPPLPEVIEARMLADGRSRASINEALLIPGGFEAAGFRLDGLRFFLGRLAEQNDRELLEGRLVALHHTLSRPGGPARVASALGMAS